jgi:ComF family protein
VDSILAISDYHDPIIKEAIHQLKYSNVKGMGEELGSQLKLKLGYLLKDKDLVVPVPLHTRRQRVRGFNQAQVIAQVFVSNSSQLQLVLDRRIFKHPQVSLTKKERLGNVEDVFAAKENITQVKGKNIFLIDDVATTGATLNACAKVLKKAGARKVTALVIARD